MAIIQKSLTCLGNLLRRFDPNSLASSRVENCPAKSCGYSEEEASASYLSEDSESLSSEYPQDLAAQDILELAKHMAETQDSSAEDILALAERLARKEAS